MAAGIDLSNNNSSADWNGVEFAFLKATEGVGFVDKTLPAFRAQCEQHSVEWGPYHFAHPDVNTAQAEAEFFLAHAPKGTLPPALDFETRGKINPLAVMGVDTAAAWIDNWCAHVERAWNQTPFFYSFRDYARQLLPKIGPWPLWLASASGTPGTFTVFKGRDVVIEQWGIVGGVDRNEAYVDLAKPVPAPSPTPSPGDKSMYIVSAGGNAPIFITDFLTKRKLEFNELETICAVGDATEGVVVHDPAPGYAKILPAAVLDAIPLVGPAPH